MASTQVIHFKSIKRWKRDCYDHRFLMRRLAVSVVSPPLCHAAKIQRNAGLTSFSRVYCETSAGYERENETSFPVQGPTRKQQDHRYSESLRKLLRFSVNCALHGRGRLQIKLFIFSALGILYLPSWIGALLASVTSKLSLNIWEAAPIPMEHCLPAVILAFAFSVSGHRFADPDHDRPGRPWHKMRNAMSSTRLTVPAYV